MQELVPGLFLVEGIRLRPEFYTADWWQARRRTPRVSAAYYHTRYTAAYNVAIAVDPDGATLLDTGFPGSVPMIEGCLRGVGLKLQDIKRVIISHIHTDHTGSMREVIDLTGARLYCHKVEAPYLTKEKPTEMETRDFRAAERVDVLLEDGDRLEILGGVQVIHTPGHTPGHICLYLEKSKALWAADLVRYYDGWFDLCPPQYTVDYPEVIRSMKKVAQLDFEALLPYHGQPLVEGAKEGYQRLLDQMEAISELFHPDIMAALSPRME